MALAFISHVLSNGNHPIENQIRKQRSELSILLTLNFLTEQQLLKATDKIENNFNRKRKLEDFNNKDNKKSKQDYQFTCDLCDKVYKHKKTLTRLISHFFLVKNATKPFKYKSSLKKHKVCCRKAKTKKSFLQMQTSTINI